MIPTALLQQTLRVEPREGEGASGPVFGEVASYRCRLEGRRRQVSDAQGEIIVSDAVAYLRADAAVAVGDRATCEGVVYRVLQVSPIVGLASAGCLELTLGRSAA